MLRRTFLGSVLAGLSLAWSNMRLAAAANPYAFEHGVASGDPLQDGVVIWTRLSGAGEGSHALRWQVASDAEMQRVVRQGIVWTDGWLRFYRESRCPRSRTLAQDLLLSLRHR